MSEERKEQVNAIVEKVKELIRKGSLTRVTVRDKNGKKIFSFSANAGVIGSLIALHAPILTLGAVLLANSAGTTVEAVKTNGEVIDLSGAAKETAATVRDYASGIIDAFTDKRD